MARRTRKQIEEVQVAIADQLKNLPANYLDCRDPGLRHQWDLTQDFHAIPVAQIGRKMANLARTETCQRCGAVKTEKFIVNVYDQIEKVSQGIDYPEGYLLSGGIPRGVKRSTVVWTANYQRAMEAVAEGARGGKGKVVPLSKRRKAT